MTEHSEIRIPIREAKVSLVCSRCKTEVVIDPKEHPDTFAGETKTIACVCGHDFARAARIAVHHFIEATKGENPIFIVARRARD